MKKISILIALLCAAFIVQAQSPLFLSGTSYTQDFDNLANGLPLGWRVDTSADQAAGLGGNAIGRYNANTTPWNTSSRGFYNFAAIDALAMTATSSSADQANETDRALGVKQVGAWDLATEQVAYNLHIANTTGLSNLSLSLKVQTFQQNSSRNNIWLMQYALGANPTSFVTLTTIPTTIYVDSNAASQTITGNFGAALNNQSQDVWIRLIPSGQSQGLGNRPIVAIDDVQIVWSGIAAGNPKPNVTALSPLNNATNVAINSDLVMTFDKNVSVGTGNITIYNLTDATQQTITLPNANVSTTGMTATIANNTFAYGKNYAVQFDSTAFVNGVSNSFGIYDNTTWNFTTESAPTPTQTSLNETFTGCNSPQYGLFSTYSVTGTKDWSCSIFGRTDSNAVYMNGYASGSSQDNEDWLISPKMDLTGMNNPYLHFWSKKRFNGNNTKEVYASSNYTSGDPSLATWTNLNVNLSNLDTLNWNLYDNTDLSAFSQGDFHFAFKYVSSVTGTADIWSLDDIYITDGPLSIGSFTENELAAYVLGDVTNNMNLQILSNEARSMNYSILDISGKRLSNGNLDVREGKNNNRIAIQSLASGLYFLQLNEDNRSVNIKFIVK